MTTVRVRVGRGVVVARHPQATTVPVYGPCPQDPRAVLAVWTLAHEAVHLSGERDEATTDCHAIQEIEATAEALGVGGRAAHAMAVYAAHWYESVRPTGEAEYSTPECRDGGALDLHPGTGNWPS
jgi:hypothetical protein